MLPKPSSVTAIDLIEAQDLNDLVAFYNELWNDPSTGPFTYPTHNDTTGNNLDRRYGWGQAAATIDPTPIASTSLNNYNGTVVTLSDINQITAQINAGGYHKEDSPIIGGLIALTGANTLSVGDKIPTSLYNSVCTLADNLFTDQYKTDFLNLSTSEVTSVNTVSWTDDLAVVHKFVFTDYNEARHFFNSGGEFTLELSMANGGGTYNQVWQNIFDQFDSIRIGAEECRIVTDDDNGETQYDVISTSGVNKGFYTGLIYSSTPEFNTILDAGVFRYGSGGDYAYAYVYEYSEYNSRRIRIQIKADEVGGTFNIYVKVILIEDIDDISPITQNVTLTSGYAQPSTVPVISPPDVGVPYTTVGSTIHQFIERAAPTVTEETPWQSVDVTSPQQLEDWIDGSTNWTYSGSGTIFNKNIIETHTGQWVIVLSTPLYPGTPSSNYEVKRVYVNDVLVDPYNWSITDNPTPGQSLTFSSSGGFSPMGTVKVIIGLR